MRCSITILNSVSRPCKGTPEHETYRSAHARLGNSYYLFREVQCSPHQWTRSLGGNISYTVDAGSGFLSTGDFVTLYDAGGTPINLAGDMANSSLFTITTNLTDTPAPFNAPFDNATITNLRFTYIGTANLPDALLGTFSLADPAGTFRSVSEDGAYHLSAGPNDQAGQPVPIAPGFATSTPEPSSFCCSALASWD